jgi:hypothetical protein
MRVPIRTSVRRARFLLVGACALMLVAGCGGTWSSPGAPIAATPVATTFTSATAGTLTTPSPMASDGPAPTGGGGIPPLLASVPGFEVSPIEPLVIDGFTTAAKAWLGTNASLGDAVGARATNADNDPVDLIAFTVLPATGVTENDALFLIMDGIAQRSRGDWVADEATGWFALDHDSGRALMIPWGNVPGATVFLLVVGAGDAPVDEVANAILGAG